MLVLATRGSALALWQANRVAERLREVHDGLEVRLHEVKTMGDRVQDRALSELPATGVFTKEVDAVVIAGRAHAAVHSLKDQLTGLPEELILGMVLERGAVEDALVSRDGVSFEDLPPGARIATGSLRRRAQMLRWRPDVRPVAIRGNVETRLRKLEGGEAEAVVLARAGLERLGLADRITQVLPPERMLPAVSQGIVGITCRAEDQETRGLLAAADDVLTHHAARAERAFLGRLGGGCNVPAAAHAVVENGQLSLRARVLDCDGRVFLAAETVGSCEDATELGLRVADELLAQGAGDLIRELRA